MKAEEIDLRQMLEFRPQEGRLMLGKHRMLMFRQESLAVLQRLLGAQLGPELSRAILSQFGYRCGEGDYNYISSSFDWDTDVDRLAAGPIMHTWEGLVHVTPNIIEYDRDLGTFLMTGEWRNSYEADLYLKHYGTSEGPVCHTLTGYASGWGSAFFGHPLIAIETACVAQGDPCCQFEIRRDDAWGATASPWRDALALTEGALSRRLEQQIAQRHQALLSANSELEAAKVAAEAATEAKSRFLAMMSHEIRTPLSIVIGLAQTILETNDENDWYQTVASIESSARGLLQIINDVLDFSKIEAGRMEIEREVFDLHALASDIITHMRVKADEKALLLNLTVDSELPRFVWGDATRVRQILLNLTSNAVKFTAAGNIEVTLTVHRDRYLATVSDTGPGIPEDQRERVFERFDQLGAGTAKKHGGTGLGLAISRDLARLMDGDLTVANSSTSGAAFRLDLPLEEAPAPNRAASAVRDSSFAEEYPLRILVAEDNELLARIVTSHLSRLGYESTWVADGARAVAEVQRRPYDLVLMDMQMPEMDGLEASRAIRKSAIYQPRIVALTANVVKGNRELCIAAGMDDFLAKPISRDGLLDVLANAAQHDTSKS